jgi:hypothetical protein
MAIFGLNNQLLQIDTGVAKTYLYNPSLGFAPWAGLGENQVLGQRYAASVNATATNPSGAPAIYMLVKYLATSAITTANLTTAAAPAPVYWTDETYTTVTGITTEALSSGFPAGFMLVNTTTGIGLGGSALTAAALVGSLILIQVAGYLPGAYISSPNSGIVGSTIIELAGTLSSNTVALGTATGYPIIGRQASAFSNTNYADVLVLCDII